MRFYKIQQIGGFLLREQRKKREKTLRELGKDTRLSFSYIAHVERGRRNPSIVTIHKLFLHLDPSDTLVEAILFCFGKPAVLTDDVVHLLSLAIRYGDNTKNTWPVRRFFT